MKHVCLMRLAAVALAAILISGAAQAQPTHRVDDGSCGYAGPNWFGVAHVGDFHRVASVVPISTTSSVTKVIHFKVFVPGHFKFIKFGWHIKKIYVPGHFKVVSKAKTFTHHSTQLSEHKHWRFNFGQYVGTSVAAAAVEEIVDAALTPCRQLTLSEAYANAADAFLPFVGGWLVRMGMPDTPQTYRIARLVKEGKLTQEQGLAAYVKAYNHHH